MSLSYSEPREAGGTPYIPYRDSKLTRLLQNSLGPWCCCCCRHPASERCCGFRACRRAGAATVLTPRVVRSDAGGNSFTTLLATAHSTGEHYEETMSTLQFANRCRNVKNQVRTARRWPTHLCGSLTPLPPQPRVNYADQSMADKDRRIKRLLQEIAALRAQLESAPAPARAHCVLARQWLTRLPPLPAALQANVGQRMAAMAADLGLHGEVQADGTFLLDNGAVLGAPADSPLSAHVRGSDSVASVARSLARAIAAVQGAVAGSAAHRATATAAGSGAAAAAAAVAARGGADDGALDDGALDDGALAGMADGMLEEEELAAEEGAAGGRRPGSRAGRALFRGAAGVSLRRGNSVSSMAQLTDTLRVLGELPRDAPRQRRAALTPRRAQRASGGAARRCGRSWRSCSASCETSRCARCHAPPAATRGAHVLAPRRHAHARSKRA